MPASESTARSASADSRRDSVATRVSSPSSAGAPAGVAAVAGAERPAQEQREQASDDDAMRPTAMQAAPHRSARVPPRTSESPPLGAGLLLGE